MDRFTHALEESLERIVPTHTGGNYGQAINSILIEGRYAEMIPFLQRERFSGMLIALAQQAYVAGFTRRYTEATPELLVNVWDQQVNSLTALLRRSLAAWDAELTRTGKPAMLRQRFPLRRLRRDLEPELRAVFLAGQREGYKALKHRLAEDTVEGIPSQQSMRMLVRDYATILNGSAPRAVEAATERLASYSFR